MVTLDEHLNSVKKAYSEYEQTLAPHIVKLDYWLRRVDSKEEMPSGSLLNLGCLTGRESGLTVVEAYGDSIQILKDYDVSGDTATIIAAKLQKDRLIGVLFFYAYAREIGNMFSNNILLPKVAIGHSSIKMTEKYAHNKVSKLRADMAKLPLKWKQAEVISINCTSLEKR